MSVQIVYSGEKYFKSFHDALSVVAREKIYIEMIEAPPLERITAFQNKLIAMNGPTYFAVDGERVVGWCDVFPIENPRQNHRGGLGMGLLPEYRGQGLGTQLVSAVLEHSKKFGLEKVELEVYSSNLAAVALYKKMGFEQEGLIKKYRKLDGRYFDAVAMGKFLK